MLKELVERYRARNHFNISDKNYVDPDDLTKILKGKVTYDHLRDMSFYIVSNEVYFQKEEGRTRAGDILGFFSEMLDESEWFGKFTAGGEYQIIIPGRYDLFLDPKTEEICLEKTEEARYYDSGYLQIDKDLHTKILQTNVGFDALRELVNTHCSGYENSHSLRAWDEYVLSPTRVFKEQTYHHLDEEREKRISDVKTEVEKRKERPHHRVPHAG